jgi:hypothetical protein
MLLEKLIAESKNLRAALDDYESLGRPKHKDDVHVRAYVVHASWRRHPRPRRKLSLVSDRRRA